MYCFIHPKQHADSYCKVCKRSICKFCVQIDNGICPRCGNFTHKTISEYNKKSLKFFIPFLLLRCVIFWDVFVLAFFSNAKIEDYLVGIILLIISLLPFVYNIIKYGISISLKFQIIGKRDAILISDNVNYKTTSTWILGIIAFIILAALIIFITPLLIITDLIHVIVMIRDYFYHNKRVLSETKIKEMDMR